jgi:alpha/beta superfamily hydrolase
VSQKFHKQTQLIAGPVGDLETILEAPENAYGLAVVCHPHPLYQGTMTNKVVHTLARAWIGIGCAAVRFNFRGVGQSAGEYAAGEGETQDALAVIRWAREQQPAGPLFLGGFSFGGMIAYRAAQQVSPAALVTVAPAVDRLSAAGEPPQCPWLVVHGDADELVPIEGVMAWLNELESGPELAVIAEAEHFFHGRLIELRGLVADFAAPFRSNS